MNPPGLPDPPVTAVGAVTSFEMTSPSSSVDRSTVEAVVAAATRAPSLHNSQPWRFVARAAGDGTIEIDLRAAFDRLLSVSDPHGRELHIACGAALELARLKGRSLGRDTSLVFLPSPEEPDFLGRLRLGGDRPADPLDVRLATAIESRHTARERFEPRPVAAEDLDGLRGLELPPGAWVRFVERDDELVSLAVLLARADDVENADERYLAELASWRRSDDDSPDGIPPGAVGATPVQRRASSLRLRDFTAGSPGEAGDASDEPPPPEHPLPVIIGTVGDDAGSWLVAGQTLGRLLLEATARGIGSSPMTQVLEVVPMRTMLVNALGLLGYPQMLLRLGYESGQPLTGRRPLADVLTYE